MSCRRKSSRQLAAAVGVVQPPVNLLYSCGALPTAAIPRHSPVHSPIFPSATASPPRPQPPVILSPPPTPCRRATAADLWRHHPPPPRTCSSRRHPPLHHHRRRPPGKLRWLSIIWRTGVVECHLVPTLPKCLSPNPAAAACPASMSLISDD